MPYVNLKLVKGQATPEQKKQIISGLTELIGTVMGRRRDYTVVTVDELEPEQWAIGGETLASPVNQNRTVSFVNIKISRGTSNPEEMARMLQATKQLFIEILGSCDETNYCIIEELNPDGWGLDGITMTARKQQTS